MKKILLLLCVSVFSLGISVAQVPALPAKCEAFQPSVVLQKIVKESELKRLPQTNWGQNEQVRGNKRYWTVYSDRSNNTLYASASNKAAVVGKLSFNEKVIIARIQNNYALVYSEPKIEVYPKISTEAQCKGWIPMTNLLLWNSCIANDRGIYNKALLCINLEATSKETQSIGKGYYNPQDQSQSVKLASDMKFYFIMKRENGMALLSTQYKMDGYSEKVLAFWVPESSYVPWNQRSCAEPTWIHEDVKYFSDTKKEIKIFDKVNLTGTPASTISFKWNNSEKYDQYEYRMSGDELRYPILDDGTSSIYSMSTFSVIGGSGTVTSGKKEKSQTEKIEQTRRETLEDMKNINLGIVIDGTSSMEEFYPAVKEAIKEGCKYFSGRYKIKVGVCIYRDYDDGEEGLVEILPMMDPKANQARLEAFLNTGGQYGIKSSPKDKTNTEALYYGINAALDRFSFKKDQSNIMLVVGDCGNAAEDSRAPKLEELVQKLVKKEVHLMGFQVRNRNQTDFNAFNNQLQTMMRSTMKKRFEGMGQKTVKVKGVQYVKNGQLNGYDFRADNADVDLYIFNHRFTDPTVNNGIMNTKTLETYLENSIGSFAQTVQGMIDIINSAEASTIIEDLKKSDFATSEVNTKGMNKVSDAFIKEKFKNAGLSLEGAQNQVVNFRGYTPKKDESTHAFFKPVIFMSLEEYQELLKRLAPVNEVAQNKSNDREPYINAMKALVKSLAPGMSDAEMAALGNGEIMSMIAGLNEAAAALNEYTLNDLANQSVISPQKYLSILTNYTRKYKNLKKIFDSKTYKYIKEVNGVKYYWIPIEDLP